MTASEHISKILSRHLELTLSPVAVSLLSQKENAEREKYRPEKPLKSYCHGIIAASWGRSLYLLEEDILCQSGTATLGFSSYSEDMLSGRTHYQTGVFGNIEAARKTVARATKLQNGSTAALFLRPLAEADGDYQVLVIAANPEQVMFILVADNHETGGRTEISMATGFQGVCGDATAYVLMTGKTNFSVTGFGDRLRCGLDPELMMVGIPKSRVSVVAKHLESVGGKLLARYKKARRRNYEDD
jgi:uncharacterized protein (DUF169 family)